MRQDLKTGIGTTMSVLGSALLCLFPATCSSGDRRGAGTPDAGRSGPLAFINVTVVDVSGGPSFADAAVVVEGERISTIGRTADVAIPAGARVIDGTGKYLVPGLWDMHVHVSHEEVFFPLLLAHGVTGVREMGNDPGLVRSWRKAISEGKLLGPRMYSGGPIVDGPDIQIPKMRLNVSGTGDVKGVMDRLSRIGADFVKVWSLIPRDAYFELAAEAGRRGLSFAGHIPIAVTALEASKAGQKSVEHLANVLLGCSTREAELMKEREAIVLSGTPGAPLRFLETWFYKGAADLMDGFDEGKAAELFRAFKDNGTWMCPTLSLWRPYAFLDDPALKSDPRLRYVPAEWDMQGMWFLKDQTADDLAQVKRVFAKDLEIVGAIRRSGVRFLAGTDTPNIHLFPGFSLHDELGLLVDSGFSPLEALQAATIEPARFMGTLETMGTVEAGKVADLVLCDGDPTADIRNLGRIHAVVANGRLIDEQGLRGLLEEAARKAKK